jgi:hypothetical protein
MVESHGFLSDPLGTVLDLDQRAFALWMALVAAMGLLLAMEYETFLDGRLAQIAHEIGHAMIVAAILGVTVDAYARRRHEVLAEKVSRKINTDVIGAIYGQQFPAPIRAEVQKSFLEQRVHREGLVITYTFRSLPRHSDRLLVEERSQFVLVNSTDQPVDFHLMTFVECPYEEALKEHCKILAVRIDGNDLAPHELVGEINEMEMAWSKQIKLPAKGRVEVVSSCQTIKDMRDMEVWSSVYPSDGIVLNVSLEVPLDVNARCQNKGAFSQKSPAGVSSSGN